MKKMILMIIGLLLTGCSGIYRVNYTYQPPHTSSGQMCATRCFETKNMCQQMCQMQDQSCRAEEHQNAFYRYQSYRDQQIAQGKPLKKNINDFDNSFSVCHETCHCISDFNLCYQSCGGAVIQNKECVAFCK